MSIFTSKKKPEPVVGYYRDLAITGPAFLFERSDRLFKNLMGEAYYPTSETYFLKKLDKQEQEEQYEYNKEKNFTSTFRRHEGNIKMTRTCQGCGAPNQYYKCSYCGGE
jgi:hypothetical protein